MTAGQEPRTDESAGVGDDGERGSVHTRRLGVTDGGVRPDPGWVERWRKPSAVAAEVKGDDSRRRWRRIGAAICQPSGAS